MAYIYLKEQLFEQPFIIIIIIIIINSSSSSRLVVAVVRHGVAVVKY